MTEFDELYTNSIQKKCFFKRTRQGGVIRLVREHMIRSDLGFGYLSSSAPLASSNQQALRIENDQNNIENLISEISANLSGHNEGYRHGDESIGIVTVNNFHTKLPKEVFSLSHDKICQLVSMSAHKQLLVIDTNIALHQIDLLEYNCPETSLVLVPQTVLQEVQHLNKSIYNRINSLLQDESRSYIFYPNEVSSETLTLREPHESINDRNDRAIRQVAIYFQDVIGDAGSSVLLTNDKNNKTRAIEKGIQAYSMNEYVTKYLYSYLELFDLLSAGNDDDLDNTTSNIFTPHLSSKELLTGVRSKKYLKGTLRCKRGDWDDCYVVVHSSENEPRRSVNVQGSLNVNRAIDGDVVVLELIAQEISNKIVNPLQSEEKNGVVIAADSAEPSYEAIEGLTDGSSNSSSITEALYGRVVGILKRNWRHYAGSVDVESLELSENSNQNDTSASFMFYPVEKRVPPIKITTRRYRDIIGNRLLVAIDNWTSNAEYPVGHIVRIIGKDGEKKTETDILLHEFGVPSNDFTAEVMACLPPANWSITPDVIADRADLRHLPIVSIDPPGCKDIDDALHCIKLPSGNYQVGVHIADVTYFVHPDTPLDKEASHRSTSTYLVERRLDMLPGYLTTQLCSLRSSEDHLAFSVLWEMTPNGQIVDVSFTKSVIHSVASLTYDQAQSMLDAPKDYSKYSQTIIDSVVQLNVLAKIFRERRISQGALTLASPEVRFKLDDETQNPSDVTAYALKESNALVEEFMLLANITVSKKILRHYPTLAILRRHQPPSREQFAPLVHAALISAGLHIDISSSKALADSLDAAVNPSDPYFNKLLRILSTRCMMPAQYFCSGEIPKDQWHHYGLAAPVYTHFTSPIRRYADVLVHRLLAAAIGVIPLPPGNTDRSKQQELCSHMNRRHRAAQYAQRASVSLYTLLYFKHHPTIEVAYILTLSENKISVLVPKFGIEMAIDVESIISSLTTSEKPKVEYMPDSCKLSISMPVTGESFELRVLQKVKVSIRVEESKAGSRNLVMNLVEWKETNEPALEQSVSQSNKRKFKEFQPSTPSPIDETVNECADEQSAVQPKKRKRSSKQVDSVSSQSASIDKVESMRVERDDDNADQRNNESEVNSIKDSFVVKSKPKVVKRKSIKRLRSEGLSRGRQET